MSGILEDFKVSNLSILECKSDLQGGGMGDPMGF